MSGSPGCPLVDSWFCHVRCRNIGNDVISLRFEACFNANVLENVADTWCSFAVASDQADSRVCDTLIQVCQASIMFWAERMWMNRWRRAKESMVKTDTISQLSARRLVARVSPTVLQHSYSVVGTRFLSSNEQFLMGCSSKCACLRLSRGASKSVGASDGPLPAETHRAPKFAGRAPAAS